MKQSVEPTTKQLVVTRSDLCYAWLWLQPSGYVSDTWLCLQPSAFV